MRLLTTGSIRQVPWMDWAEWDAVRQLLLSDNLEFRKQGVDHVEMWKSRISKLPPAITATAEVISLIDSLYIKHSYDTCWCLAVSMCIVRTVNLLVDPLQKKSHATSISGIADKIGIPKCLIRTRHQATHNIRLPSPVLLLNACRKILDWIINNYWNPQCEILKGSEDKVRNIIKELVANRGAQKKKITKREILLIKEISNIESLENPPRVVAMILSEEFFPHPDRDSKPELQVSNEMVRITQPPSAKKLLSAWTGLLEEIQNRWPGFMLQLLYISIEKTKNNFENEGSQASFLARFCLSLCLNDNFVQAMEIVSSNPSPITLDLLKMAMKARPDKKHSITHLIDALKYINKNELQSIKVLPSYKSETTFIEYQNPTFETHPSSWCKSHLANWEVVCPIGKLPVRKFP